MFYSCIEALWFNVRYSKWLAITAVRYRIIYKLWNSIHFWQKLITFQVSILDHLFSCLGVLYWLYIFHFISTRNVCQACIVRSTKSDLYCTYHKSIGKQAELTATPYSPQNIKPMVFPRMMMLVGNSLLNARLANWFGITTHSITPTGEIWGISRELFG